MVLAFVITGCTSATAPVEDVPDVGPSYDTLKDESEESTYELVFHAVPATLAVGETLQLSVQAHQDGAPASVQRVSFESRTPSLLSIDAAGRARGLAVGTAYLSAFNDRGIALAEIEVVER